MKPRIDNACVTGTNDCEYLQILGRSLIVMDICAHDDDMNINNRGDDTLRLYKEKQKKKKIVFVLSRISFRIGKVFVQLFR